MLVWLFFQFYLLFLLFFALAEAKTNKNYTNKWAAEIEVEDRLFKLYWEYTRKIRTVGRCVMRPRIDKWKTITGMDLELFELSVSVVLRSVLLAMGSLFFYCGLMGQFA